MFIAAIENGEMKEEFNFIQEETPTIEVPDQQH